MANVNGRADGGVGRRSGGMNTGINANEPVGVRLATPLVQDQRCAYRSTAQLMATEALPQ